jgi:glycerol-3-phosphate dehydrogenase
MTIEGVPTSAVAVAFAKRCGLELPIFNAVYAIIEGELPIEVSRRVFFHSLFVSNSFLLLYCNCFFC